MKKAFWFSRHQPTADQVKEITDKGFELINLPKGMELGAVNIQDEQDVANVLGDLADEAKDCKAIFGVFPPPIQSRLLDKMFDAVHRGDFIGTEKECFAAWNVQRTSEGGKPTFTHKMFTFMGMI